MAENEEIRFYGKIGSMRLLDIRVIADGNVIYEGKVDSAPDDIREKQYYELEMKDKIVLYVH